IEESGDIIRSSVLIIEIICMLPYIKTQDRRTFAIYDRHQRIVLIGSRTYTDFSSFMNTQPCPSGSELCGCCLAEGLFKLFKTPKRIVDRFGEITGRFAASILGHDFPEKRMIVESASVISHSRVCIFING